MSMKKTNKNFEREIKKILIIGFLIFGFLAIALVFAYPILDSGIARSSQEDQLPAYTYNFTQNVTGSITGSLVFSIEAINSSLHNFTNVADYYWISINSSTGIMTLNSTRNNETGIFNISIHVIDSSTQGTTVAASFNVSSVNDAPAFANLENKTFNMSELFTYLVNVTDEENSVPFVLNITFTNCSVAQWSTRNCSNSSGRELFNSSYYNFNSTSGVLNISFTPQKNDVGSYTINFSVMDNSSLGNKTTSQIVNFTVLNMNSAPYFRYVCDNERNATENSKFTCWINVSDTDEAYNVTFSSNYSWFTFYNNSALVTSLTVGCNSSTNYNASAMVNFTPTDIHVGNWSINISVTDVGSGFNAPKINSSVFWFFINNTEDSVSLNSISNLTIYQNTTIYVNATDNDLLVTQKNIKNEILTFKSNTSWVNISTYSAPSGVNYTTARIIIDYNTALSIGAGNYTVNVNVTDTGGNFADRNFTIQILGDNPVTWNATMSNTFVIYENNLSYWNFTQNVTDADGDSINFSYTNDSAFPSFAINLTTGIINFTPADGDVGYHNITINASDGKLNSLKSFNFTIYNVNDNLSIETPLTAINASVDVNSNINCTEDNATTITLWIQDDDFKIPSNQKSFYNESLNVSVNITGVNSSLFSFSKTSSFPTANFPNRTEYVAIFTPRKTDLGSYNITINITDASNFSVSLSFNLTISSINHAPVLMNLTNHTSAINRSFYYRINATDIENGNSNVSGGNTNFTFRYNFTSGSSFLNTTTFNSTTGEVNITFNSTHGGKYHLNITVNDSLGAEDSGDFWIYVYDMPNVSLPASNYAFNLAENNLSNLTFRTNHSVGDNLTYEFYIMNSSGSNILKYNISYYGNATNLTWQFTPNLTDETYNLTRNLTLIVYPSTSELTNRININTSYSWNITINHTNAPVVFSGHIGDSQADYNNVITINLSNYFSDIDYSDNYYNQTINFSASSNSTPSYITKSFSNWTLTLSSLIAVTELLNITAMDLNGTNSSLTNATSNNIEIKFTTPTTTATPTPSSGGGDSPIPVAFKIISPRDISAYAYQKITIPLTLENKGNKKFEKINITIIAFKDGNIENKVITSLDKNYVESLEKGETENLILTVFFNTNKTGDYEILINATSKNPKYTDWTKIYINLQKINESEIRELLIFTEEFIVKNPECIEITEIVNEARDYFEKRDFVNAKEKAEQAISKCKESISQPGLASLKLKSPLTINQYLIITTLSSMIIGISYYFIKRRKFKRMIISGEISSKE